MRSVTVRNVPEEVHRAIRVRAARNGLLVASRDVRPFKAAGITVINPWDA